MTIDEINLRARVGELLELVFAEDTILLDSLPENLEAELVATLGVLADVYRGSGSLTEIIVAARLVRRSTISLLDGVPRKLKDLITGLPE